MEDVFQSANWYAIIVKTNLYSWISWKWLNSDMESSLLYKLNSFSTLLIPRTKILFLSDSTFYFLSKEKNTSYRENIYHFLDDYWSKMKTNDFICGVIEGRQNRMFRHKWMLVYLGYYGRPWSFNQRKSLFE